MKIKTFKADTPEDLDAAVNNFEATHRVKATQTHVIPVGEGMQFVATAFYEADE